MGMAWIPFFIVMWLLVAAALYTWYRAVKNEERIRQLERR